jgi:hypothetical protein
MTVIGVGAIRMFWAGAAGAKAMSIANGRRNGDSARTSLVPPAKTRDGSSALVAIHILWLAGRTEHGGEMKIR